MVYLRIVKSEIFFSKPMNTHIHNYFIIIIIKIGGFVTIFERFAVC